MNTARIAALCLLVSCAPVVARPVDDSVAEARSYAAPDRESLFPPPSPRGSAGQEGDDVMPQSYKDDVEAERIEHDAHVRKAKQKAEAPRPRQTPDGTRRVVPLPTEPEPVERYPGGSPIFR